MASKTAKRKNKKRTLTPKSQPTIKKMLEKMRMIRESRLKKETKGSKGENIEGSRTETEIAMEIETPPLLDTPPSPKVGIIGKVWYEERVRGELFPWVRKRKVWS